MKKAVVFGENELTLETLADIARNHAQVSLSKKGRGRIEKSRRLVDKWVANGEIIYGITTGFGALSDIIISREETRQLQKNILMSHAAGVGEPLEKETVRAVMALRINDLAKGYSGIRPETVDRLIELVNADVCPIVPEQGSVGASGDLAPLAHLALVLIGMGEALFRGKRISGREALDACGLQPIELQAGEGLALVNGTQVMTAIGALALYDAVRLAKTADIAAAMSLEVLMGSRTEFDPRIHQVRPHPGQGVSADNLFRITKKSEIISSHKDCHRVQDAYTLRCSPQVHGASRDVINYVKNVLKIEMNGSTCNPIIFSDTREFLLGGNFHGQPIATALDFLCIGVSELANISERRIERLVNPQLSGLPAFLVSDGGLNSGFMIAQYTAAALVSENKVLSHPACVDSIPTSANKEDHVSMGAISARKSRQIVKNAEHVIAIELLCAAQAMDLFTNLKPGKGTLKAYRIIRKAVRHLETDRVLSHDIGSMVELIRSGKMIAEVEEAVGALH
ncbi:MAG: histidine ammonia-lyase [Pseudomonadota bacterium]